MVDGVVDSTELSSGPADNSSSETTIEDDDSLSSPWVVSGNSEDAPGADVEGWCTSGFGVVIVMVVGCAVANGVGCIVGAELGNEVVTIVGAAIG